MGDHFSYWLRRSAKAEYIQCVCVCVCVCTGKCVDIEIDGCVSPSPLTRPVLCWGLSSKSSLGRQTKS